MKFKKPKRKNESMEKSLIRAGLIYESRMTGAMDWESIYGPEKVNYYEELIWDDQ